jgi:hypothetical protein
VDRTGWGHTVWWAGSYWVTPNQDRLVGGGRQVIMRTAPVWCVSRLLGQAPTQISCDVLEMFERFSCDVAFEAAHDLSCVLPFVTTTSDIRLGCGVATHAG